MKLGPICTRVMNDIAARELESQATHGDVLTPQTKKDFLLEAYEEAIDLAMYLKGELMRREPTKPCMKIVRKEWVFDDEDIPDIHEMPDDELLGYTAHLTPNFEIVESYPDANKTT